MSDKAKMPLTEARYLAEAIKNKLAPYCQMIAIAGSIRREKSFVGDIEIVAIPKTELVQSELFGGNVPKRSKAFSDTVLSFGWHDKGDPAMGKMVKMNLHEGISLDLFICQPENWGYIFMLRTGSDWFNKEVLIKRLHDRYYDLEDGWVKLKGNTVHTPLENDMFQLMRLPNIPPHYREEEAYYKYLERIKYSASSGS